MILIGIVFLIYVITIVSNVIRTNRLRKRIKPGDSCSVYRGEVRTRALVTGVSEEIEVMIFGRIWLYPRNRIYA